MSGDTTFQGKTILITGAAQGIGRAIAEEALARGGSVAAVDLNAEGIETSRTRPRRSGTGACAAASPTPPSRSRRSSRRCSASARSTAWSTTPASCARR